MVMVRKSRKMSNGGTNWKRMIVICLTAIVLMIILLCKVRSGGEKSPFHAAEFPSTEKQSTKNAPSAPYLQPKRATFAGREVLWQFPPAVRSSIGNACPATKSVLFLYHGCGRLASSFFYSPQGRDMMKMALNKGVTVVAFTKATERSCWSVGADLKPVMEAGRAWVEEELVPLCGEGITQKLSVFGFGASSGGSFVARVAAEKSEIPLRAINVQIMAPARITWSIPTFFTVMSRDDATRKKVEFISKELKEKGVPTQTLVTKPKPVTPKYFLTRFSDDGNMSTTLSQQLYDGLRTMKAIDPDNEDALILNPRTLNLPAILENGQIPVRPYGLSSGLAKLLSPEELRDAEKLWFEEELNVAYDQHEITAEGFSDVLDFFLKYKC